MINIPVTVHEQLLTGDDILANICQGPIVVIGGSIYVKSIANNLLKTQHIKGVINNVKQY